MKEIDNPFFFYTDEFLTKEEVLEIEKKVMYSQPFFLYAGETAGQDSAEIKDPGYVIGDIFSDYPFLVSGNNDQDPKGFIPDIGLMILDKLNISKILPPVKMMRCKSNLTSRTVERKLSWPHIDSKKKHFVALYYVNDSDGDTVIYNQKYSGEIYDQSELTVFKTITPKAGSIIIFDGGLFHTNYSPEKNDFRCVININLKPIEEVEKWKKYCYLYP